MGGPGEGRSPEKMDESYLNDLRNTDESVPSSYHGSCMILGTGSYLYRKRTLVYCLQVGYLPGRGCQCYQEKAWCLCLCLCW